MLTNFRSVLLAAIFVFAVGVAAGYWIGASWQPPRLAQTVVERTISPKPNQDIPIRQDAAESQPERVVEYRTTVKVDTVYVPVPQVIRDDYRVSSSAPIEVRQRVIGPTLVNYTSFNPQTGRWETAEYRIEQPRVTYGAEIASGFMYPAQPFVEAKVYAGYKRVEPFAGVRIDPLQTAPFVGVRVRFGR